MAKVNFRKHPIHVMFAHFPSALFPTAFIFNTLGLSIGKQALFNASFYCQLAGLIMGSLTVAVGIVDLCDIYKHNHRNLASKGLLHGSVNIFVLVIYFGIIVYRSKDPVEVGLWLICIEGFTIVFLIISNYFGAEVYRRQIEENL